MRCLLKHVRWAFAPVLMVALLTACSSNDMGDEGGGMLPLDDLPVLSDEQALEPEAEIVAHDIGLPSPAINPRWAQVGGDVTHAPGNLALGNAPVPVWSSYIGEGSSDDAKILAAPLIVDGMVFAQDAHGYVSAYSLQNGSRHWRVDIAPQDADTYAMGGGIAWANGVIYATTGFGQVVALRAQDGLIAWRQDVGSPVRAAPTVAGGRVFVVSLKNESHVLDAQTGRKIWHHRGIAEKASLLGASSPAVKGDIVVVPYSSGELFGLRTQNGRLSWSEVLAASRQTGVMPSIADIRGLPVIANKRIYAISHSGRFAAIDQRSGMRVWESDLGGINTPSVVGKAIYLVTNEGKLVALSRQHGKVLWSIQLELYEQAGDEDEKGAKKLSWHGPVMANGRLWVTGSTGVLAAFAPEDGSILYYKKVGDGFYLPPVVANQTMVLLSDNGELVALR